jgi:golgin subfamily A member 4
MAKKECEEKATKLWEEEDKKKQEDDALALEETKKKGGKPPATKPKDPKKLQAEIEERKKVLMQEIGLRNIEEVTTGSGSTWLAYRSLFEIATEFYKRE